jgi:hypothetical protein
MRHLLTVKTLMSGLSLVFIIAACARSPIPDINQDILQTEILQEESEPPQEQPIDSDQVNRAPLEAPELESDVIGDSLPNENQSPGNSYPPPIETTGENNAANDGYPEPAPESGYPASENVIPTLTLMPYPAPANEQDSSSDPPPIKTGLEATDPSTVNLASGELQFVEFFAFW